MNFLVLSCSSYNQLEKAMNLELQEKSNIFQHTHLHALKVFWFNHLNFFKKLGNYPTNFTNSLQFYNLIHLITIYLSLSFYIFIYIYIHTYTHTFSTLFILTIPMQNISSPTMSSKFTSFNSKQACSANGLHMCYFNNCLRGNSWQYCSHEQICQVKKQYKNQGTLEHTPPTQQ